MNNEEFGGCIAGFIFLVLVGLLAYFWNNTQCRVKAEMQELNWSYGVAQGCMVKQDGQWIDYSRLRYME